MAGPSREWLDGTTTISREEFGHIIQENIEIAAMAMAIATNGDAKAVENLKGILMRYSAAVAMDVFRDGEPEDRLEIE